MTYRALELLNLPPDQPAFLLDVGCGSGLSGEILDEEGYVWAGVDIAPSMLGESIQRLDVRESDGRPPQRWPWKERCKAICSCKTLVRDSVSAREASMAQSGNVHFSRPPLTSVRVNGSL